MSDSNKDSNPERKRDAPATPGSRETATCPKCGCELAGVSERGLCPRCLMAEAMAPTEAGGTESTVRPKPPEIAAVQEAFPQLEILEVIGVGGMGVVYKARQTSLNRVVALKLLAPHREAEPGFAERFTREARALAVLSHPNIVTIHDFGQAGGFFYLLMEHVDGVNLREAMQAGRFTPEQALAIVPPICEALQFAHDRGIVHRDIKPANLLMDKNGRVKVADFGIARILDQSEADGDGGGDTAPVDPGLTAGTTLGTPNYMAPEQAEHPERVDHRADIYSLGVVIYEMLTGEPPAGTLTPPSNRVQIDVRLDEVVLRALAHTPEQRWQSATDLRAQVDTIVSTRAVDASPEPPPLDLDAAKAPVAATSAVGSAEPTPAVRRRGNGPLWLAIALAIPGVPLAMFGVFLLVGVLNDPDWNPTPQEAFFSYGSWIAPPLLLGAGFLSFCHWLRRRSTAGQPRRHLGAAVGVMVGVLLLLAAGIGVVSFGVLKTTAQRNADVSRMQARYTEAVNQSARARDTLTEHRNQTVEIVDPIRLQRADELENRLAEEAAEAERLSQSRRATLHSVANPSRLVNILTLAVVGIAILGFLAGGIVLLAKSSKGGALGCVVVVVLILLAAIGLVLLYLVPLRMVSHSTPRVAMASGSSVDAEAVFSMKRAALTSQEGGVVFSGEIDVVRQPAAWDFWVVSRKRIDEGGQARTSGSSSSKLSRGTKFQVRLTGITWNDDDRRNVDMRLQNLSGARFTMMPGSPVQVLRFTTVEGEDVSVSLELRPASAMRSSPANQIFLREVEAHPEEGRISLAWNEIMSTGGYDVMLETEGASVQMNSVDQIDVAGFEEITDPSAFAFTRRKFSNGGALRFDFPAMSSARVNLPEIAADVRIQKDQPHVLFDLTDNATQHRARAVLKLVPEGTLAEVLPPDLPVLERPVPR